MSVSKEQMSGDRPNQQTFNARSFPEYLENWQEHIVSTYPAMRKLTEMSVTMNRRDRGLTISDMVGGWGTRRTTDGRWLDYDPDADGAVHPINIVQPALRANTNACLQSSPVIEVSSANQSALHKQIAMKWQNVANYFERFDWDENTRTILFDGLQKSGLYLTEVYLDRYGSVDVSAPKDAGVAIFACAKCGMNGITQTEEEAVECPQCGEQADTQSISEYNVGEQQAPMFNIENRLIPFYNIAVDRYNAKIKGLAGAKWLQIHELIDRPTLESAYPQFLFNGDNQWNFQLRCDYALANADWRYLGVGATYDRALTDGFELFECRYIYLHEDAYINYVAPADYKFVNGHGKETFRIKRGQTIPEAYYEMYKENPEGMKFVWQADRLLDIVSPEDETVDFRKRFTDVHWQRSSTSYYSSPNYSIVTIQDDITLLNTMNHNIIARNAVIPTYYNSLTFQDSDFSKEYIGTSNSALLPDGDISKHITQLPIPTPSPHLSNQLSFLWQIKDSVSQVQPALRGEQQKGETYGAQRQQLEQSYGLLSSVLKSYANMLVNNFKQKAQMAARYWTLEQFQAVGSMFGEPWTEQDVKEMTEINFEQDLVVSYQNGSEMPSTNLDREMKFFQGLNQLVPLLQMSPDLVGKDKLTKILAKIDEYSDFDFDLTGLEVNELIAQKQAIELYQLCQQYGNVTFEDVELAKQTIIGVAPPEVDPQTGQPAQGEAITELDKITEQIFYQSQIRFSKYEDLTQQKTFFIEQLRTEKGKTAPNYLYIEMLTTLIGMLDTAIQGQQEEAIANDPQVKMAQEQQQAQMQAEADKEKAITERETLKLQATQAADANKAAVQFDRDMALEQAQNKNELAKIVLKGEVDAKLKGDKETEDTDD